MFISIIPSINHALRAWSNLISAILRCTENGDGAILGVICNCPCNIHQIVSKFSNFGLENISLAAVNYIGTIF